MKWHELTQEQREYVLATLEDQADEDVKPQMVDAYRAAIEVLEEASKPLPCPHGRPTYKMCPHCNNQWGHVPEALPPTCTITASTGVTNVTLNEPPSPTCERCGGSKRGSYIGFNGATYVEPCPDCNGTGRRNGL